MEEIIENMKDQDVVDVKCMTKRDGNARMFFFTFTLNKIPEYVSVRYERDQVKPYIKSQCIIIDAKNTDTPHYEVLTKAQMNSLAVNVLRLMTSLHVQDKI